MNINVLLQVLQRCDPQFTVKIWHCLTNCQDKTSVLTQYLQNSRHTSRFDPSEAVFRDLLIRSRHFSGARSNVRLALIQPGCSIGASAPTSTCNKLNSKLILLDFGNERLRRFRGGLLRWLKGWGCCTWLGGMRSSDATTI